MPSRSAESDFVEITSIARPWPLQYCVYRLYMQLLDMTNVQMWFVYCSSALWTMDLGREHVASEMVPFRGVDQSS